jgi:Zn-dependent protease with chaperone function
MLMNLSKLCVKLMGLSRVMLMLFACAPGAAFAAPVSVSSDIVSSDATPQEVKLAKIGSKEVEERMTIIIDPARQARAETIVNRLKPHMERNLPYAAKIVDDETINAFALAGGPIYVTTGMLDFVKTDLELAGVLAHEMAHADRKHVIIQMARNERTTLLALAAMIASRGHGAAIFAANALQVAVMGAYSIYIEKEADAIGITALTRAGYNPVGVLTLQERLLEESLKRAYIDPGIYRTHPETKERIAAAITYMKENGAPIERKHALGVLRAGVSVMSGDICLLIDGVPLWRAPENEKTEDLVIKIADDLRDMLQLESAPYDIRIETSSSGRALFIKGRLIVEESELPEGAESIDALREGIRSSLGSAQRKHPMADYYLQ